MELQLAHLALVVHHRAPASVQSPRLSCRARGAREALVAAQEPLIEEGGPVPRNTKAALPRRSSAPPSTAGGSLVDPRPSRPSSSMGRRLGDGSCSGAVADAWRCPAPAGTASGSIRSGHIRARDRTRAARPSGGWARRLPAARGAARKAWRRWGEIGCDFGFHDRFSDAFFFLHKC